jgi:hypothetical protein
VVYVLRCDELAREHHARTIGAVVAGVHIPGWDEVRAAFDEDLAAPPVIETGETGPERSTRQVKLRALGVA